VTPIEVLHPAPVKQAYGFLRGFFDSWVPASNEAINARDASRRHAPSIIFPSNARSTANKLTSTES